MAQGRAFQAFDNAEGAPVVIVNETFVKRYLANGPAMYGLFSWSVALRTRELAIRLTLGARPFTMGHLVVRQSALLVVAGLVAGLALIRLAERALTAVLYDVTPSDAGSTAIASGLLLTAALLAVLPPVIRATRVDPVEGLRAE